LQPKAEWRALREQAEEWPAGQAELLVPVRAEKEALRAARAPVKAGLAREQARRQELEQR
jgi:hypothetical protein